MGWEYSYYCARLGRSFNKGDTITIQGQSYTSAYKGGYGYNYTVAENKPFYGVYNEPNVSAPICVADSYGNAQYFIEDSNIVGGGTPVISTGNFVAYQKDSDRKGGIASVPGGWFESVYLDWNSWGGSNDGGIKGFEVWYRESSDNKNWSGRVHVTTIWTTNNYGNYTIGSVNQASSGSNWGARGYYYQWCIVGLTNGGHHSSTEFWSSTYRKCTNTAWSFNANGGSGAPATQYKLIGYHFVFPSTKPTRTGYTFTGWMRSGNSTKYSAGQIASGLPDSAITWYAQWSINQYTLTVNPNGGAWNGNTTTRSYKQNYASTKYIPNPTRTGYTFKGWSRSGSGSISGTTFTYGAGNCTLTATWAINSYTFDLNGNLDGVSSGNISGYGTADVYIGGAIKGNDISDYCTAHTYGSKYEIKDIKATTGHTYKGVYSGSLSGTIGVANVSTFLKFLTNKAQIAYHPNGGTVSVSGFGYNDYGWITKDGVTYFHTVNYGKNSNPWNASSFGLTRTGYTFGGWILSNASGSDVLNQDTDYASTRYYDNKDSSKTTANTELVSCYLYAKWIPKTYTHTIHHWANGFKNGEGNSDGETGASFKLDGTSFTTSYGDVITISTDMAVQVPNGFYLNGKFRSIWETGDYGTAYDFGKQFTQNDAASWFGFDYKPHEYKITYNLDGGTNHSSNPSTYNVLYGVTLQNPTREKYTFNGWYIGETKVTGINEGKNATFTSPDDLYNQLVSRTTGDITLTARWNLPEFYFLNMSFISCIRESATTARIKVITSFYEDVDISIINKYPYLSSSTFQNATIESVTLLNGDDATKIYTHEIVVSIVNSTDFGTFTFSLDDSFTICEKTVRVSGSSPGDDDICIYDTNACEATDFIEGDYFYGFQKGGRVHAKSFITDDTRVELKNDNTMIFANRIIAPGRDIYCLGDDTIIVADDDGKLIETEE